uniref:NADH-ubiquinone oxidoreductase chain 3 n=1 Tax=Cicadellidae gen. sp. 1 JCX-2018 TaxID=2306300 RepID=A0A346RNJ2_9HEMI|nr:NADH dehydrogenase subunit 3 [Cicadellidae gen. sp. 1 JCX-2018]
MTLLMSSLTSIIIILMTISSIILSISYKSMINSQKSSPFECGFNPMSQTRLPFSIHFFMIAVIFLIFDIEIIIIMPLIITMKISMMKNWLTIALIFIIILIMGLYYEWMNGMLNWTK